MYLFFTLKQQDNQISGFNCNVGSFLLLQLSHGSAQHTLQLF